MMILLNMIKNTTWYRPCGSFAQSFSVRHLKPREIANALTAALPWQSKPCLFFFGQAATTLKAWASKKKLGDVGETDRWVLSFYLVPWDGDMAKQPDETHRQSILKWSLELESTQTAFDNSPELVG